MQRTVRLVSKLIRLKIAGDLGRLIKTMPFENLQETQEGTDAYVAFGGIRLGARIQPVRMRVRLNKSKLITEIDSKGFEFHFKHPFGTELEREECLKAAARAIELRLN